MKSLAMAVAIGSTVVLCVPALIRPAAAQTAPVGSSGGYLLPVVVGAAAGATVAALLWPVIVPAGAVAATPGAVAAAPAAMGWGWGAFMTTRAAVGALIGAGLGFGAAR
jgi:hypothetical protein